MYRVTKNRWRQKYQAIFSQLLIIIFSFILISNEYMIKIYHDKLHKDPMSHERVTRWNVRPSCFDLFKQCKSLWDFIMENNQVTTDTFLQNFILVKLTDNANWFQWNFQWLLTLTLSIVHHASFFNIDRRF